jgi:hypothetical protein
MSVTHEFVRGWQAFKSGRLVLHDGAGKAVILGSGLLVAQLAVSVMPARAQSAKHPLERVNSAGTFGRLPDAANVRQGGRENKVSAHAVEGAGQGRGAGVEAGAGDAAGSASGGQTRAANVEAVVDASGKKLISWSLGGPRGQDNACPFLGLCASFPGQRRRVH